MSALEGFIHSEQDIDPLVRMAIIHHCFETIHPFYDGNGRTGRIINILYLVLSGLLDVPILYLSRYINHTRQGLLQGAARCPGQRGLEGVDTLHVARHHLDR